MKMTQQQVGSLLLRFTPDKCAAWCSLFLTILSPQLHITSISGLPTYGCTVFIMSTTPHSVVDILVEKWTGNPKICGSNRSQGNLIFLCSNIEPT
jgi:hypothetical protein